MSKQGSTLASWLPGLRFAIISTVKLVLNLGDCSISHTYNAIFQGLKFKSGAKIGSKMFSKKFSNFFEDSPKNSPIFLEILQKYWRISNIIGESPKIKLENALIVVYYINKVGYCYRCCYYNRTHASSEILMVILKCCLKSWHRAKLIVV